MHIFASAFLGTLVAGLIIGLAICSALSPSQPRYTPSPSSGMGYGFLCVAFLWGIMAWLVWGAPAWLQTALVTGFGWLLWIVTPILGVLLAIGLVLQTIGFVRRAVRWLRSPSITLKQLGAIGFVSAWTAFITWAVIAAG